MSEASIVSLINVRDSLSSASFLMCGLDSALRALLVPRSFGRWGMCMCRTARSVCRT